MSLLMLVWFLVGLCSHVYWWTKDHPLHWASIPLLVIASFVGPASWVIGWMLHNDDVRVIEDRHEHYMNTKHHHIIC